MTARIEAIRERHAARLAIRADATTPPSLVSTLVDDDMAVLLAEVRRLEELGHQAISAEARAVAELEAQNADLKAEVAQLRGGVGELIQDHWIDLSGSHDRYLARNYGRVVTVDDLNDVLDGDAEQRTRDLFLAAALEDEAWEWSMDDVVQEADGRTWARDTTGTYPWRSTRGHDQRDQDITDLVTKHGGRVLVCKARGIGGATC